MHLRSPDLEAPRKKQVAAQLRNSQAASVATRTARAAPERLSAGSESRTKEHVDTILNHLNPSLLFLQQRVEAVRSSLQTVR